MKLESINIARKLAWSFNRLTGIEYAELFSEACLGYAEALKDFDPTKNTQFSSFAWVYIRNRLRVYAKKERKYAQQINFSTLSLNDEEMIENLFSIEEKQRTYIELLQSMSTDAREIAELIIQRKRDLPTNIPPYWIRRTIRDMLREQGWSWPRIWGGIRLLKKALNHVYTLFII